MRSALALLAFCATSALGLIEERAVKPVYTWKNLPNQTEDGQAGYNLCGKNGSKSAKCQTLLVNSLSDFCLWGGQTPKSVVGQVEPYVVGFCLKDTHGARIFPSGTIKSAHMLRTTSWIQITGTADFSKINIDASDETGDGGGELDPHGADGFGNPIGGVMFSRAFNDFVGDPLMAPEWQMFLEGNRFCVKMCNPAKSREEQKKMCPHVYDEMGCEWNEPGRYDAGFTSCEAGVGLPPGLYPPAGASTITSTYTQWSTFSQGQASTPAPHPAPSSSKCTTYSKLTYTTYATATTTKASTAKASSSTKKSSSATSTKKSSTSTKSSSTSKKTTSSSKAKRDAQPTAFERRHIQRNEAL